MNTYCLSCTCRRNLCFARKKDTKNIDPRVIKTKNNRKNDVIKMFYLQ